ncbi:MAG: hypothetical protein JNN08_12340 [Bryobacterales bacterium]|nr:hypothetical protein [Bryobacterales bacterium]
MRCSSSLVFLFSFCLPASADGVRELTQERGFAWRPALRQSAIFLGIQHGFRVGLQSGTREQLKGPFFRDWGRSVKGMSGWEDGDPPIANYVGHPLQGAVASYIYVQNAPDAAAREFSFTEPYWRSRLMATAWNAVYSTQYEIGPLSDASIGNVGLRPGTKGAVDLVITPVLGMAWMITEDALDRHLAARLENRIKARWVNALVRTWINPSRSMANVLRGEAPWHRDTRPGLWKR